MACPHLTEVYSQTDGSLGRVKTDRVPVRLLDYDIPASEWNKLIKLVLELQACANETAPGATTDVRTAKYVVGCETSGDTVDLCTHLDIGDGAGIAAALADATVDPGDIWIRPGLYDLTLAGSPSAPFSVPAYCRVHGAGRKLVVIAGRSEGDQGVFDVASDAAVEDLTINVPLPTAGTVGSLGVVTLGGAGNRANMRVERVDVIFAGNKVNRTNLTLEAALYWEGTTHATAAGCLVRDVRIEATSFWRGNPAVMQGIMQPELVAPTFPNNRPCVLQNVSIYGLSRGMHLHQGPLVQVIDPIGDELTFELIFVGHAGALQGRGVQVRGGHVRINVAGASGFKSEPQDGISDYYGIDVDGLVVHVENVGSTVRAVHLAADTGHAVSPRVRGVTVTGAHATTQGVVLEESEDALVVGCHLRGVATAANRLVNLGTDTVDIGNVL